MDALLIIDMQNECFSQAERFDRDGTIGRINEIIAHFRSRNDRIVFVQHDGTAENYMIPGTEGWRIVDGLDLEEGDTFVDKRANDAFYDSELDSVLKEMGIRRLYCTGLATDFCFNSTVQSALTRDYDVVVIRECHTTADRPMLTAARIIAFFNWLWANLTPTKGRIEVRSIDEIVPDRGEVRAGSAETMS